MRKNFSKKNKGFSSKKSNKFSKRGKSSKSESIRVFSGWHNDRSTTLKFDPEALQELAQRESPVVFMIENQYQRNDNDPDVIGLMPAEEEEEGGFYKGKKSKKSKSKVKSKAKKRRREEEDEDEDEEDEDEDEDDEEDEDEEDDDEELF